MSKLEAYLKNKRIQELGLPKIWVVESTPNGVEKPIAVQVNEIIEWNNKFRYKLDASPFEVDIEKGLSSKKRDDYGTGFGDLWGGSVFCSLSEEEANAYFQKESNRVKEKYGYIAKSN
jgi:hypothetical protein